MDVRRFSNGMYRLPVVEQAFCVLLRAELFTGDEAGTFVGSKLTLPPHLHLFCAHGAPMEPSLAFSAESPETSWGSMLSGKCCYYLENCQSLHKMAKGWVL